MLSAGVQDIDIHCLTLVIYDDIANEEYALGVRIIWMGIWDVEETFKNTILRVIMEHFQVIIVCKVLRGYLLTECLSFTMFFFAVLQVDSLINRVVGKPTGQLGTLHKAKGILVIWVCGLSLYLFILRLLSMYCLLYNMISDIQVLIGFDL